MTKEKIFCYKGITPTGHGRKIFLPMDRLFCLSFENRIGNYSNEYSPQWGANPHAIKEIIMARIIVDSQASNSSVSVSSAKAPRSIKEIEAEERRLAEEKKARRAADKAAKAALAEEKKAAKKAAKEGGVIASIVSVLDSFSISGEGLSKAERIALCYEHGKSKEAILGLLLEKLGKGPEHEDAPLHLATLNVQLGKRILPRLEAKGLSLCSVRADNAKFSLYLAFKEGKENA